jgi:hypothetical protein
VLGNELNMVVALAVLVPELGLSRGTGCRLVRRHAIPDDSGQRHGKHQISGGREDACCALSMATLTAACRGSGVLASFYARMIVRLNAMFAYNQTWSDQPT